MSVYTTFYSEFFFESEDDCDSEQVLLWVNNRQNFPWRVKRSLDGFTVEARVENIDEKTALQELLRLSKIMVINGFGCTDAVPFRVTWGDYASGVAHLTALEIDQIKITVVMVERDGTVKNYMLE